MNDIRATNPNTVFAAAGDMIGASTFTSFIQDDNPTIDALNLAGLDVSAAGNHEFDKGWADLRDRVQSRANWEYISANVWDTVNNPQVISSSVRFAVAQPSPGSPFSYAADQVFEDAALRNITVVSSSGDGGSSYETPNGLANVSSSRGSSYNLLVGGTSVSTWEGAKADNTVGYLRQLSAEGLLALRPDAVIAQGDAGPPVVIDQLRSAGVKVDLLPSTHDTDGILSARTFSRLAPGAYVVNVARGAHLVEADLLDALASGRIAAATLDVFQHEPLPADHPFWHAPRITITPHSSAETLRDEAVDQIAGKIRALARGERIGGVVDYARGY